MFTKELPSAEYLRECFVFFKGTGLLIWKSRPRHHFVDDRSWKIWNTKHAGSDARMKSENRYLVTVRNRKYRLHRIIWKLVTGSDPIQVIDHIDCNPLNNMWSNLREATFSQNLQNSAGHKDHLFPKGVSPHRDRWQAHIKVGDHREYLGLFDSIDEAAAAYVAAGKRLHGDFFRSKPTILPAAI